jgi:hypothetical protein
MSPLAGQGGRAQIECMEPDLIAASEQLSFCDTQSIALPHPLRAIDAWNMVMADPLPLIGTAFALRDAISARFGVKRIGGFSGRHQPSDVRVGDRLDFFVVERAEEHVLTMTERDKHLDVMTCVRTHDQRLSITTSVITHNRFGRVYMLPVAPAHKIIVWSMLRRLKRRLSAQVRPQ